MEEEAARQSAETIAKAAEEKAQAVSCLLNSLGGEERLKNLRRAKISISADVKGVSGDDHEQTSKIEVIVLLDLPDKIALIFEANENGNVRRFGGVISLVEEDESFLGLEDGRGFAPGFYDSVRGALGPVLNFVSGVLKFRLGSLWAFGRGTESRSDSVPASNV